MATEHARSIIVQSTTSTQNSGFYRHITPAFTAETGIAVRVIAVGTGQALKNAQNCDGDLVIVHARDAEMRFIEKGYGLQRRELMYNDFVIIGPPDDPADIGDAPDTNTALQRIAATTAPFASRGDASGTHIKERALWRAANVDPQADIDGWYRETGNGMGATLNYSVQSYSYTLTDRATWLAFGNRFDHKILVEGDPALFNQYAIVSIN
ncbi:MAG TPA: sulfate transporter, partial [Alphaproteobacteria bacterium]|nr:sulfate transporter [Alphaproteobacteria bacterium]